MHEGSNYSGQFSNAGYSYVGDAADYTTSSEQLHVEIPFSTYIKYSAQFLGLKKRISLCSDRIKTHEEHYVQIMTDAEAFEAKAATTTVPKVRKYRQRAER